MLDTNSLLAKSFGEERNRLMEEYIKTEDPELLKKIKELSEQEKLMLTKNIIERM